MSQADADPGMIDDAPAILDPQVDHEPSGYQPPAYQPPVEDARIQDPVMRHEPQLRQQVQIDQASEYRHEGRHHASSDHHAGGSADGGHAAHLGVSEEHYRFMQESSKWSREVLPFEPQVPKSSQVDKVVSNPDGTKTYHNMGYEVTYHNDFPDFSPYVSQNQQGEPIEAVFPATCSRGSDKKSWHAALAEKGLRQPKGTDFHHGPAFEKDGTTYILGQALRHEPHHAFPHAGGFAISKAAAGMYSKSHGGHKPSQGGSESHGHKQGGKKHRRKGRSHRRSKHR
jgi:hypothetical protein